MCADFSYSPLQQPFIDRPRLLEKLKLSIHHKITLVIAPPGYGKTTSISQFVHQTSLPVICHSIEESEQDFPNLLKHSLDALSSIFPELTHLIFSPKLSEGEVAHQLTNSIRAESKSDFIYILDDVHHLIKSPAAKVWLRSFIANMPSNCHLVLVGRSLPPLPVNEMLARREIFAIGQEELSFNFQEVHALVEKLGSTLSDKQIEKIYSRMMGWPVGTLLALQPLSPHLENLLFEGKRSAEGLFDALAEELIKTLPVQLQTFLLRSSTLLRMNPNLCQSALGLTSSLEYLNEALGRNLFITRMPGGMTYHSLFRDFLQQRFRLQNRADFLQYHLNAGQWFENENRLEEAFEHFIAAEQWDQAASIAERSAHIYIAQGKTETLLYWNDQLAGIDVHVPRLHHMCAMLRINRYEYDLADKDLRQGTEEYRAQNNKTGLIQITLLQATLDNQRGNFQTAIAVAEPFSIDLTIPPNLRGYALAIIGTAELYLCHLDTAVALLETALPLYRDTGDIFALSQLLMTLELAYLRLGRFTDMARCLQEILGIRNDFGEMTGIAMALNNLGYQYLLLGDYRQALETLNTGLQSVSHASNNRTEGHLLWTLGDLQRDWGNFKEAANLYQRSLELVGDKEPFLQANINISLATLKRWEGNLDTAYEFAVLAQTIAQQHNLRWEKMLADIAIYGVYIEQGEIEIAYKGLESIIHYWEKYPSPQLISAVGLSAYAALQTSDKNAVHRYLKLGLTRSNHAANIQPLIVECVHNLRLKLWIERHRDQYEDLIQKMEALGTEQHETTPLAEADVTTPTYSLRISVLGQETIKRDGDKIPSSDWEAASARELFFYLLFGKASSREQLGLILWPDSSSLQVRQKFHATLRRARNAIGANVIVFENDLYSINPKIDLWYDVHEFKLTVKQARLSSPLLAHSEILWDRAVKLYNGEFLPAFDSDWVISYREILSQMYIDALISLANCIRVRGDIREAIRVLKQALETDPYREDIHRTLLNYYKLLGDHSTIVRHMRALNHLFVTELGTIPSAETRNLSKTLLS